MKHQEVLWVNQLGKVYRSRSVIVGMPVGTAIGTQILRGEELARAGLARISRHVARRSA